MSISPVTIADLPDDCLREVFSRVPDIRLRAVCKHWKELVAESAHDNLSVCLTSRGYKFPELQEGTHFEKYKHLLGKVFTLAKKEGNEELHKGLQKSYARVPSPKSLLDAIEKRKNRNLVKFCSPFLDQLHVNLDKLTLEQKATLLREAISEKGKTITHIGLFGKSLTVIPGEIGAFSELTHLNLGGNRLKTLPVELLRLNKLQSLHVCHNPIKTLPPEFRNSQNRVVYKAIMEDCPALWDTARKAKVYGAKALGSLCAFLMCLSSLPVSLPLLSAVALVGIFVDFLRGYLPRFERVKALLLSAGLGMAGLIGGCFLFKAVVALFGLVAPFLLIGVVIIFAFLTALSNWVVHYYTNARDL